MANNLEAAGLLHRVMLATCDGTDFVATLPDGIDFVLVDYGVREFATAFKGLCVRMAVGCLLFEDGGPAGYWERDVVRDFKAPREGDPCFVVTVLPMHKDQLIAVRVAA